ncbi:hypothetical protein BJY00DRAFT_302580 [Aspergillus carlsbadensis]|nr:hypothetical protein BJY00DRAFT_302580 [Aspergillus carlsbadensis]
MGNFNIEMGPSSIHKLLRIIKIEAIRDVLRICEPPTDVGGLGLSVDTDATEEQIEEVIFLVSAALEAINSADREKKQGWPLMRRPPGRRDMTLGEKILAHHAINGKGWVAPGELIWVDVDWALASEASWKDMERTHTELGKPDIFRSDRFWLAWDRVGDPAVRPEFFAARERARRVFKLADSQGKNATILHTEFYHSRAQPGLLVVGSDPHTCSAGALGCLAIGTGAADATLPLVTGKTWFRVPETIRIRFEGKPRVEMTGRDTMLYIFHELKQQRVAADRIVEFSGPGAQHLTCDDRFAICNMTEELGGITGLFVPDGHTHRFDAQYAASNEIDLDKVEAFVAVHGKPDDVVPVSALRGQRLTGCFIGGCATTEKDLIIAGRVLEHGRKIGMQPSRGRKRKMVAGSGRILDRLRDSGLVDVYERAGFEIGLPACSYCAGVYDDCPAPQEVWLSSQSRSFDQGYPPGLGPVGHLASAATVAASSFKMEIRGPHEVVGVDPARWARIVDGLLPPAPGVPDIWTEAMYKEPKMGVEGMGGEPNDSLDEAEMPIMTEKILRLSDNDGIQARVEWQRIVVAKKGFGPGPWQELAARALRELGVRCVIAESFSWFQDRNMPMVGLLGITVADSDFYEHARSGERIRIDLAAQVVEITKGRYQAKFPFELGQTVTQLLQHGGPSSAFQKFGRVLLEQIKEPTGLPAPSAATAPHGRPELEF